MELREPKKKKKCFVSLHSPFPVPIESVTGIPTSCAAWKVCTGRYNGDSVVVDNSDEVSKLYYHGFFGKGSLSRSFPEFGKIVRGIPPFIRQRQFELHRSWDELKNSNSRAGDKDSRSKIDDGVQCSTQDLEVSHLSSKPAINDDPSELKKAADVGEPCENKRTISYTGSSEKCPLGIESQEKLLCEDNVKTSTSSDIPHNIATSENTSDQQEEKMVLVVPDSDEEDVDVENFVATLEPKLEADPFPLKEALHLSLEEAFFLSYALGCLKVMDLCGNNLSLINMWQLFCDSQKDFVQLYVAYHYFRTKNWVVKTGLKFGGDFVLYKHGPPFYHASYIVKVNVVDGNTQENVLSPGRPVPGWTQLMGLHRLAETAAKEVLLCQVVWPTDLPVGTLRTPKVISEFTVREVLIRRWVTSKERENEWDDL